MDELKLAIRDFVAEREWEQFHTPKNLAMALAVEAAELMEPFQWIDAEQSRDLPEERLCQVREELGDVLIYLVRIADVLEIDLLQAAKAKLEKNRQKYPTERVRGKSLKYNEYPDAES